MRSFWGFPSAHSLAGLVCEAVPRSWGFFIPDPPELPGILISGPKECEQSAGQVVPVVLIKPSHYDDDGYVVMAALDHAVELARRRLRRSPCGAAERLLGPDLQIDVMAMDETNTPRPPGDIVKQISRHGGLGLVGFVGVQSNEFPRALDLARPSAPGGIQVMIGGFHVSGCLAMLKDIAGRHQGCA